MRSAVKPILAGLLALALASCASAVPPDTFEIAAPVMAKASPGRTQAQILIPPPTALMTLDSQNIVIKPSPYTVEYLGNSQWSDKLPRMVQLRLLQAFENTGRIGAVGVPGQGLAIDYQLLLEIRKFEIQAVGSPRAVVEISVKALNDRNGSVLRTKVFNAEVPVSGAANADYVSALNTAYDSASRQIVSWTFGLI